MQTRTVATVIDLVQRRPEKSESKPETSFMSFLKSDLEGQERLSAEKSEAGKQAASDRVEDTSDKKKDGALDPTHAKEKSDAAATAATIDAAAAATAVANETRSAEERGARDTKQAKRLAEASAELTRQPIISVEPKAQPRLTHELVLGQKDIKQSETKDVKTAKAQLFEIPLREHAKSRKQEAVAEVAARLENAETGTPGKKVGVEKTEITKQDIKTLLAQRANLRANAESRPANESNQANETQNKAARERTVTVQLNPEKWIIQETTQRSTGEKSENQSERKSQSKDSKLGLENQNRVRMEVQRENAFAELLKPQIAPAEKEKLTQETKHLFNQLVEKARINLGSDGQSSASLRLKPEQLGSVTLNLKVYGNVVEAKVLVENDSVKKLVKDEMDQLQRELKRQGFSVDAIEIRVREPQLDSQTAFNTNLSARDDQAQRREQAARQSSSPSGGFSNLISPDVAALEYEPAIEWNGSVNIAV
ncbi:MAG: flagellar hook-length control protein FliK [Leptospirales bacterium]|nr:flagellar hook-length control protein FliK [Leptospirales bacterium]